jgi:hypothetical protein
MRRTSPSAAIACLLGILAGVPSNALAVPETTVSFTVVDLAFSTRQGFDLVEVEGCHLAGDPGHPLLPRMAVNFVIPRDKVVASVKFEPGGKQKLPGSYYIFPAQPDSFGGGFVWPDPSIYESADPFPGAVIEAGRERVDWGWITYQLMVWPLEYVPSKRELWVYTSVNISLELVDREDALPEVLPRSQEQHQEWAELLQAVVANPGDVWLWAPEGAAISGLPARWVLILPGYPEPLEDRGWYDTFLPLITWRQQQGHVTEVKYARQISPSLDLQEIRDYLWQQHTEGARWACLVGDHVMIPWTYENPNPWGLPGWAPNDWCYCDLDGTWPEDWDWAPELWVGRVPCVSQVEAGNFVDKVLVYEENPGYGNYAYLDSAFYEEADEMQQNHTCHTVWEHQDHDVWATFWGEVPGYDHDTPWFPYGWQVAGELSATYFDYTHFNYVTVHTHGGPELYACLTYGCNDSTKSAFGPAAVEALTNDGYYFFMYSTACKNAWLDWNDPPSLRTLAELVTCVYPSRGAVAFGGNTRDGTGGPPSTRLQCCAWDWLFPQGLIPNYFNHAGRVEALSKWKYDYLYGPLAFNCYIHNLFGDPATPIWKPRARPPAQKPLAAENALVPLTIRLVACDPNPVHSEATLRFSLNRSADVGIGVYDIAGRLVRLLDVGAVKPGASAQHWDCSGLPSGVYTVRVEAEGAASARRAVILR